MQVLMYIYDILRVHILSSGPDTNTELFLQHNHSSSSIREDKQHWYGQSCTYYHMECWILDE